MKKSARQWRSRWSASPRLALVAVALASPPAAATRRATRAPPPTAGHHRRRRRELPLPALLEVGRASTTRPPACKLNYQSIGSGGGIAAIKAKTVDFGASDAPLEQADLDASRPRPVPDVRRRCRPGRQPRGRRRRPAQADRRPLAKIFIGDITTWNDPAIAAANAGRRRCPTRRSTSSTAPTARGRPGSSPTTWRGRSGRVEGRRRTRKSPGRSASAARATRASPPACSS